MNSPRQKAISLDRTRARTLALRRATVCSSLSALLACVAACGPAAPAKEPAPSSENPTPSALAAPAAHAIDTALGGRLFDKFYGKEPPFSAFVPDSSKTQGVLDGQRGPAGNGTLRLGSGEVMNNDAGHDYRLKNFFGWDLKGREGIYGPSAMAKGYAVSRNLLGGRETREELVLLFTKGDHEIPAYGDVLTPPQIEAMAAYVIGVRDGALPHPDQIFAIKPPAEGHYALLPGGDAARGKAYIEERCSSCHGDDGTEVLFDDGAYSLGSHARQKAYEDWHKILNGQPGSPMGRQVRGSTGKEMAQELLDILAALCDRAAFPAGKATAKDVEDGDGRCGPYLK
ncbi:uncharacterized protein SOCEGT47_020230 [Sorangium cellulosum]|uniref:Cytochrome c domain-containing protein n=1 Tax=Sorangium cellulosum TaxID=56 RepID=A0A4P2PXJ1_SORCE|nr:hypothetical protein [Sorangium cellulosum]AUX21537.1 uncharacterized protein SOCEGT47_020230 [Sorangium cellulosum]